MQKGKFWAVLNMSSHSVKFCETEAEANSIARSMARSNPKNQFVVVESHYGFIVETEIPITRVDADDILYGEIEF